MRPGVPFYMDKQPQPETPKRRVLKVLSNIFFGAVGMLFFFGDRALREFWHFSFWASVIIWAGVLGVIVISGVVVYHLLDG